MYTFLKPVTWQIAVRGTAIHLELLSRFIGSERPQWSAADKPNIQFSGSCAILPARAAVFPAARPALAPNRLPIHSSHRRFTKFQRLRGISTGCAGDSRKFEVAKKATGRCQVGNQ
jgi:hypothetical protein